MTRHHDALILKGVRITFGVLSKARRVPGFF